MILYAIILVLVGANSQVIDGNKCNELGVHAYIELGCTAVYNKSDGCPSYFNCPKYIRSTNYCNFQGKKILEADYISVGCKACSCVNQSSVVNSSIAKFICAQPRCARKELKTHCYHRYILGGVCCHVENDVCPPFDNHPTCIVDGITYRDGEKFIPKGTCKECVCQKGYTGQNIKPFCMQRNCAFEFERSYSEKIEKNCAPAYYYRNDDKALCCPDEFICPSKNDVIKKMGTSSHTTSKSCKFGDKEIAPNEGFERSVTQFGTARNLKCICELPPYLTCTAEYY